MRRPFLFECPTCGEDFEVSRAGTYRTMTHLLYRRIRDVHETAAARLALAARQRLDADASCQVQRRATIDASIREAAAFQELDYLKAALVPLGIIA